MSYRQQRDYENLNKAIFDGVGEYDIPVIEPDSPQVDNWISFNYAKGCEEPEIHGIHFFIELGAYWQMNGIRVIPTISWADRDSYEWCFAGEPEGYTVAVSSVGTQGSQETRQLFLNGYREMMTRLQPQTIIMYGTVPDECQGNIIPVKAFQQKWRND